MSKVIQRLLAEDASPVVDTCRANVENSWRGPEPVVLSAPSDMEWPKLLRPGGGRVNQI